MVRILIIGSVIAVAFTLYALVDAAMTDGSRARGVGKPIWVVLVVVLPVIGGILWFTIGKGSTPAPAPQAPDDDPRFSGTRMSQTDLDAHMRDLEARLRELDDEKFPGEDRGAAAAGAAGAGAAGTADSADPSDPASEPRGDAGSEAPESDEQSHEPGDDSGSARR